MRNTGSVSWRTDRKPVLNHDDAQQPCYRLLDVIFRIPDGRIIMLQYAIVFFIIALIAALFGFTGIAAGAVEIAKVLFFIFVLLFLVSLVMGLMRRK